MDEEVPKANIVDNLAEVVAKSNFLDEFVFVLFVSFFLSFFVSFFVSFFLYSAIWLWFQAIARDDLASGLFNATAREKFASHGKVYASIIQGILREASRVEKNTKYR